MRACGGVFVSDAKPERARADASRLRIRDEPGATRGGAPDGYRRRLCICAIEPTSARMARHCIGKPPCIPPQRGLPFGTEWKRQFLGIAAVARTNANGLHPFL